ncbi:MAG: non-ribosomal peptide synthetase, partial [Bacteroidota bacterium]
RRFEITHSFQPTILIPEFVRASKGQALALQFLTTGGDSLAAIDTNGLSYRLFNNYGPSENTVVASYYEVQSSDQDQVPAIGRPIYNTQLYLLDQYQNLVPPGVIGEIYIGGTNLAVGYLHQETLTNTKFIDQLFEQGPSDRLYRTGDLATWTKDGVLHFKGRKDDQIQIRGYRIELGEIEITLSAYPGISEAIILAQANDQQDKTLIAYFTSQQVIDIDELRDYLNQHLPPYMIPTHLIPVEQFPLTPNGKIDKKALPNPIEAILERGVEYLAPRNETDRTLTEIWSEVLNIPADKISIDANFFELGGHSMRLIRLNHLIKEKLNSTISMVNMFKLGSIRLLSDHLHQAHTSTESKDEEREQSAALFTHSLNLFNNDD